MKLVHTFFEPHFKSKSFLNPEKMFFILILSLMLVFSASATTKRPEARSTGITSFTSYHIVPEVLVSVPVNQLTVFYNEGHKVDYANALMPNVTKESPVLVEWPSDPEKHYTLLFLDVDTPSRTAPLLRSYLHWLIVNIPGHDIRRGLPILHYSAPSPAFGTGWHRLVFLVYEQPNGTIEFPTSFSRRRFQIKEFAKQYSLGQPFAGNFYFSMYESPASSPVQTIVNGVTTGFYGFLQALGLNTTQSS